MLLVGMLPTTIKKLIYRLKGYKIGKNVTIGLGAAIVGKNVVIEDNASFGFLSIVRGSTIKIGRHVTVGSTSIIDSPHIELGDGAKINEQVFV